MLTRLAVIALLNGALAVPALAQDASPRAGRQVAVARCGECHAVDATGESPNPRAPRFRDLGAGFPFAGLRDALSSGMMVSHPSMPKPYLTRADSGDLVAYLESIQAPTRTAPPRGRTRLPLQSHP